MCLIKHIYRRKMEHELRACLYINGCVNVHLHGADYNRTRHVFVYTMVVS